jgi:hypothetical protein
MNININPENIDKYKKDMMNLYRSKGVPPTSPVAPSGAAVSPAIAPAPKPPIPPPQYQVPDTQPIEPPGSGIQVPDTQPITVPGYQIPDTQPIEPPGSGIQVPDTQPITVPGYQIPDTQPIEVPYLPPLEDGEGIGYLRTQVYAASRAVPIEGALVLITQVKNDEVYLIRMLVTDENGYTETVPLPVPVDNLDNYPNPLEKPFRDYRLSAYANGYYIVEDVKVPIMANVKSLQPIQMVPLRENEERINILPSPGIEKLPSDNPNIQSPAGAPIDPTDTASTPPSGTVG